MWLLISVLGSVDDRSPLLGTRVLEGVTFSVFFCLFLEVGGQAARVWPVLGDTLSLLKTSAVLACDTSNADFLMKP